MSTPRLRSRTFAWSDPAEVASSARRTSGLEFLRSIAGRDRPQAAPVAECMGFSLLEAGEGRAVFELVPDEFHYNPIGVVHGGVLATLLDSAAGASVHSTLAVGEAYTSLEIKVSFIRAVTEATGPVRAEGRVIARGSRVATVEAQLVDGGGKLLAHATSTCLILAANSVRKDG
jgi:uncharacterized protein (TIGR00369 family)